MKQRLSNLIVAATRTIERVRAEARRPALMCSFGKDSMVLLHILRHHANWKLPVIFLRDPWWPRKYAWAQRQIEELGLEVHDWAPMAMTMWEGREIMAFTGHYQLSGPLPHGQVAVPKNILEPEPGKPWLCGLDDVIGRPTGGYNAPWDWLLIGHKSSDRDQIAGEVTLHCDVRLPVAPGVPAAAFPLRQWTDDDIWDYTEEFGVPQQEDRYDIANRKEWPDKTTNSDYAHVCIRCFDPRIEGRTVFCPKLGMEVDRDPNRVTWANPSAKYFGKEAVA